MWNEKSPSSCGKCPPDFHATGLVFKGRFDYKEAVSRPTNGNRMKRRSFLLMTAGSPLALSGVLSPVFGQATAQGNLTGHSTQNSAKQSGPKTPPAIVPPSREFMATLPRLMELAQLPGAGMAVVHGNRLEWQHYAGVANASTRAPITAESLFPAASMGKQLFAYVVLLLADAGEIDLDRPLRHYVKDDAPTGDWGNRITARHILSHSSGLPNWRWERDQSLTPAFEPGTKFRYSGEGFYYLQRCVEKITATGCEQFMQERLMKPLGMNSSTYLWRADAGACRRSSR